MDGEGNNATIGLNYEYRVNSLLGFGAVPERAVREFDAITALLVADVHIKNGIIMQLGSGIERHESEE